MLIEEFGQLPSCFITATDTDAGKTYMACEILKAWQKSGLSVAAFKPIASGGIYQDGHLVSEDALALATVTGQTPEQINPFVYEKPASPHIADVHGTFDLEVCLQHYQHLLQQHDRVLVEGVGGWCVPLSSELMLKELVAAVQLPVVMVVNIKLGCINHALLTAQQIKRDQQSMLGWVANRIDTEYADAQANIDTIAAHLNT
ncbi:dethiobiotin synthase [Marinicella sp. W31]|uniref:dethiobiotin synthase n=1 Tax=Marinicella sp. W31 TaxID=3023713 RepID=UPI0037571D5E